MTVVISEKKIDKNTSQELSESDKSIINKMINKFSVKEITNLLIKIEIFQKKKFIIIV